MRESKEVPFSALGSAQSNEAIWKSEGVVHYICRGLATSPHRNVIPITKFSNCTGAIIKAVKFILSQRIITISILLSEEKL